MGRDRNDHGRYDDRIDPSTVLEVFDAREDRCRPLTAGDVVDELDIARRTAHNKLNALVERGVLETRKVGARGRVWWTPDAESARERDETTVGAQDSGHTGDGEGRRDTDETRRESGPAGEGARDTDDGGDDVSGDDVSGDDLDGAREILRELDLPGRGAKLDARIETILTLYTVLRERQDVSKDALLALVDPDDVGYKTVESFWGNCVMANKSQGRETNTLVALPGVEKWGGGEYRYTGDGDREQ